MGVESIKIITLIENTNNKCLYHTLDAVKQTVKVAI